MGHVCATIVAVDKEKNTFSERVFCSLRYLAWNAASQALQEFSILSPNMHYF